MASTRYSHQPMQIYQDPDESFDHAPMPSFSPSKPRKISPLRPIKNAASRRNIIFNPPQAGSSKPSPHKSASQTSSSPLRAPLFGNKINSISMPPPGGPTCSTDSLAKREPMMAKYKQPQKAMFSTFGNGRFADKENYAQPLYQHPSTPYEGFNPSNFSLEGLYAPKPSQKRTLLEALPIPEPRTSKRTKVEELSEEQDIDELGEIPAPDSFPPLDDDGKRPSHSYATLIGMSILRAPNRRLTLAQIYKWITDTYSYYKHSDPGWQNSIRHNLSLSKAFVKQERPKDDPGKGNYWVIVSGMEHQFVKEKSSKKGCGTNENVTLMSSNLSPLNEAESSRITSKPSTPAVTAQELPPPPKYSLPQSSLPANVELDSDATIPASDALAFDPELENVEELEPSSPLIRSSPPAMMHSSPPITRRAARRQNTPPPPVPHFQSSSRSRSHKRKFASMDDSGYFSNLDSSALRSQQVGRLNGSEADRPRIKRGRAEAEIARLRGSSYDSPIKGRPNSAFVEPSSSPLRRQQRSTQMLPPLTPAMKLRAPVKPPPSASPNTNLEQHRKRIKEMIGGSPLRGWTSQDDIQPWSPEFNLDDLNTIYNGFNGELDLFANVPSLFSAPGRSPMFNSKGKPFRDGSPEKRSAKRPRLDRPHSTNVLADITNSNFGISTIPVLNLQSDSGMNTLQSPVKGGLFHSPVKGSGMGPPSKMFSMESPSKLKSSFNTATYGFPQDDDFLGSEFLTEEVVDFGGMDLMQGFGKIGQKVGNHSQPSQSQQPSRPTPRTNNSLRPPFARSFTSRF